MCNKKRKPNQNSTRAPIVIAGAGAVIAGARIIITKARIIIAGTHVFWRKNHKNRFLLTLLLVFSGKIRIEEKYAGPCNPAWPVSAYPAKSPIRQRHVPRGPQIYGPRKPRPNIVPWQSFTGQASGPHPWLPSLLCANYKNKKCKKNRVLHIVKSSG